MRFINTTIQLVIWIITILSNQSHMVSSSVAVSTTQIPSSADVGTIPIYSSEAVSATQISQQLKQKIMVDFDVSLTIVDSIKQQISSDREIFQNAQCKKCKQENININIKNINIKVDILLVMKGAKVISPYLTYISVGLSVTRLIYSIVNGNKINKKLDILNDKLDDISREINSLRDELKASIEFNTWLVHINEYEQHIRNGEEFLNKKLDELQSATDEKAKMKLANEFLNYYDNNDIEGSAQAIYRLTGKPPTATSKNLFDLLVNEKGCDNLELSRLMMILRDLMASAAKQELVYYFFKDGNENRVGKSLTKYQKFLYDIRDYYNNQAWNCFRNSVENAKMAAMEAIDDNKDNTKLLSSIIQEKLSSLIPWYSWTVAQFEKDQAPDVTVHNFLHSHSVTFKSEGETYFSIKEYTSSKINIIVIWQDIEDVFRSCDDIDISSTKVYFKPCTECSSSSFVNSNNMNEEHTCNEFLKQIVYKKAAEQYFNPNGLINSLDKHPVSFVVANKGKHTDACIDNPCLNNGICNPVIYTNSRFCMCKPFFEGSNCENDIGNFLADNATVVLGKLREHFGIMTGIPDVIDIYFQINELSTDIKNMQQSIQYYSEYENLVSLYGKSIKDAEYISNYYHDFQKGKLEFKSFGKILDKFDFDYILLDFGQMITGDAILVEDDFLTSRKKIWSQPQNLGGCTKKYSNAVKSLMRNLVTLDQLVVESMIWHARWKISNTLSIQKKKSFINDVHQTFEYAKDRQKLYFDNWDAKSCPKLNITNAKISETETIHCDNGLSFEGLNISVQCMDYALKTRSDHIVTCSMNDTTETLEWLGIPDCHFATSWSNWTDWSDCSVTCDNGTQISYRRSTDGQIQSQTQVCINNVTCCESAGNQFCSNRVCIQPKMLCDGNDDCGNNEDEKDCRYLRVGDHVAIKAGTSENGCGKWLGCWHGHLGNHCHGETCPGENMDLDSNNNDWTHCSDEVFNYIAAENRTKNQAIRHGDRVALRFRTYNSEGFWLTCQDFDHCVTHNCPGEYFDENEYKKCTGEVYWILSEARSGNCVFKDSPGCIGDPIQPLDKIHLLHDAEGTGSWVSGDKDPRLKNTCDVRNRPPSSPDACNCEQWEIHIRRYAD